jgi:hypothetical protein
MSQGCTAGSPSDSLEPAGDSALTAIRSGTQQFVADHDAGRQ